MIRLKTTAVCLSLVGVGAVGAILAAPQITSNRDAPAAAQGPPAAPKEARPAPAVPNDYVIEPPDVLLVETLMVPLPGRPVSGERLVRPDGKISLGFYGEVYVAGLTRQQAKVRIVEHLRKYLSDEMLGLLERDRATGDYRRDEKLRLIRKDPGDTDRVIVDVSACNSKNYYVLGDVRLPGKFPSTGHETVLDALQSAGGLMPSASPRDIRLVRPAPPGACCEQVMAVELTAITGGDPTSNYQLMPGDRLIVQSGPVARPDAPVRGAVEGAEDRATLRDVERRLGEVERKLDRLLHALERRVP